MRKIWKRRIFTACIIGALFVLAGKYYRTQQIDNVEDILSEIAVFASEPLWHYDINAIEEYFKLISEKNNFSSLQVIDVNNLNILELSNSQTIKITRLLSRTGLLPEMYFEHDILYEDQVIGKILVEWVDDSVYFYVYIFIVAVLLYIILQLYLSTSDAKASLEEQFQEVKEQKEYIERLFNIVPEGLITLDRHNNTVNVNTSYRSMVKEWAQRRSIPITQAEDEFVSELVEQSSLKPKGQYTLSQDHQSVIIEYTLAEFQSSQNASKLLSIRDITRFKSLERQLVQAQKLESVGRLAAGIAHEINTPTQYVLTNIDFIDEAIGDITEMLEPVEKFIAMELDGKVQTAQNQIIESLASADWEYLKDEMPDAISQAKEGIERVSKIVLAMKNFSHPSGTNLENHDVNQAIETTVSVARNEWKYVAELNLNLDQSIPQIPCYLDELNQVFLIMIVNSAHAIADKYGEGGGIQGVIAIETAIRDNNLVVTFRDNGNGISPEDKGKIFDPFFTTKAVDKGTGQGLTIAHDIVVKKHKGEIKVDSEPGKGTVFEVIIPKNGSNDAEKE
ncbi:sensor histidine kinase [Desulforhopalus sp. 52FAK]